MSENGASNDQLSPTKRALLELRKLRAEIDALQRARSEPIAIVGVGCRFPGGANDPDSFWRNLRGGVDAISDIPAARWDVDAYYDPDPAVAGKMYTRHGGFLEDVESFDAAFFGITPREARGMDPQQRLLLETSWEALERAGIRPDSLVGSQSAVFVGVMLNDYAQRYLHQQNPSAVDAYYATGTDISFAAGRISYVLGLQGPSMTLNTVCSSSLVTVHLACQSLRSGESDLALAGGVNVITSPEMFISLSRMGALAPDGRSKTFAANADGYGRSEGCGVVVLKRLSDAQADGDPILALIRGSAVNHDGPSGALTVPNGPAQQALIRRALQNAGVEPNQINYVEAHGSGTPLGDPIEIKALNSVLNNGRDAAQPLMVGSVKANIGHLESAAGVAGLIKVVLALQNEALPPQLHLQRTNPALGLEEMPVTIPTELIPWQANGAPRFAGVSSFGLSGINAHVVVEEAPAPIEPPAAADVPERPYHLLTLSARDEAALQAQAGRYERFLEAHPGVALADVAYTANTTRAQFDHRLSLIARDTAEARALLGQFRPGAAVEGLVTRQIDAERDRIAFLFPGQGGQYAQMGRELYATHAGFRQTLEACAELVRPYLDRPLLPVIYPAEGEATPLDQMMYAQPAMFSIEYALAQLWRSWGIQPELLLGHSLGEYVAACLAGVFTLADGLKMVAARGRLMQQDTEPGLMVVAFAGENQVAEAIAPYQDEVGIAAINGARSVTLSGRTEATSAAVVALEAAGVRTRRLNIPHAAHSPLMEPIMAPFRQVVAEVALSPPQLEVVSNVSGRLAGAELATVDYWVDHLRRPVRFTDGIACLQEQGAGIYVEMGPRPTLSSMGQREAGSGVWLPSLRPKRDVRPYGTGEWQKMLESLGALHTLGVEVDWDGLEVGQARRRLALPTYPFQRQRYWLDKRPGANAAAAQPDNAAPPVSGWLYELAWEKVDAAASSEPVAADDRWLILADDGGAGQALAATLRERGHSCTLVWPGERFGEDGDEITIAATDPAHYRRLLDVIGGPLRGIVHLWGAGTSRPQNLAQLQDAQLLGSSSVLHLLQALDAAPVGGDTTVWLVTRGVQPAASVDVQVAQSPLWGLGRVIALEQPQRWGGLIDLPPQADAATCVGYLLPTLLQPDDEKQIAYRDDGRYAPRLVSARPAESDYAPLQIRAGGAYLISGGLGKLGLETARWLVAQGARRLVLTSRSGLEGSNGLAPDADAVHKRQVVAALRAQGAEVRTPQVDVADEAQMAALLDELAQDEWPLRGVIHAAGVVNSYTLREMPAEALHSVFRAKVAGAWLLHKLTEGLNLDFMVFFSSGASVWGSQALAHYAAANHFLDAMAHHRRAQGLPALSLNWGRWDTDGLGTDELVDFFARVGLEEMPAQQALDTMGYLLATGATQQTVAAVDWQRFKPIYEARGPQPLLAKIDAGSAEQPAAQRKETFADHLQAAPAGAQSRLLLDHVCSTVAGVIGLDEPQMLDLDQGFFAMGMDSIMTVELRNRLEASLNCSLLPTVAFEYPTANELTHHLAAEVLHLQSAEDIEPAPAAETAGGDHPHDSGHTDLDVLSDEELLSLVGDELSRAGVLVEED